MSADIIQFPRRYQAKLSKAGLAAALGRSRRWIELMQRDEGLPFTRDADGRCVYDLETVLAWMDERRKVG